MTKSKGSVRKSTTQPSTIEGSTIKKQNNTIPQGVCGVSDRKPLSGAGIITGSKASSDSSPTPPNQSRCSNTTMKRPKVTPDKPSQSTPPIEVVSPTQDTAHPTKAKPHAKRREVCRNYLVGRCRNVQCPREHPQAEKDKAQLGGEKGDTSQTNATPGPETGICSIGTKPTETLKEVAPNGSLDDSSSLPSIPREKTASPMVDGSLLDRKKSNQDPRTKELCFLYIQGRCYLRRCKRLHPSHYQIKDICPRFVRGTCTDGDHCPYQHPTLDATVGSSSAPPEDVDESNIDEKSDDKMDVHTSSTLPSGTIQNPGETKQEEPDVASSVCRADDIPVSPVVSSLSETLTPTTAHPELQKDPRGICLNFTRDRCYHGKRCKFAHPPRWQWVDYLGKSNTPCIAYREGRCFLGEKCWRSHHKDSLPSDDEYPSSEDDTDDTSIQSPEDSSERAPSPHIAEDQDLPAQVDSTPSKVSGKGAEICLNFTRDRCYHGSRCHRLHPPRAEWVKYLGKSNEPCIRFSEGRCFLGENCYLSHQAVPTQLPPSHLQDSIGTSHTPNSLPIHQPLSSRAVHSFDNTDMSPNGDLNTLSPPPAVKPSSPSHPVVDMNKAEGHRQNIPGLCWDFINGRCTRQRCRFSHSTQPSTKADLSPQGLDGLLEKLHQSTVNREKPLEVSSNPPPPVTISANISSPLVPPGLGLEHVAANRSESEQHSIPIIDSVQTIFGPGFQLRQLVTGFESRRVVIRNLPAKATTGEVTQALSTFGPIVDIQLNKVDKIGHSITAIVTFDSYIQAAQAIATLNDKRMLGRIVQVQFTVHKSTSLGKGTIHDGDLCLEFPTPGKDVFVGYTTLAQAEAAISQANGTIMDGFALSAALHRGIPSIGLFNVKYRGVPPNATPKDLDRFGPNEGVVLGEANYPNLRSAMSKIQNMLERYGELVSVDVLGPPFVQQTVRAWAHFTTPIAANDASRALDGRRQQFLGNARIHARHVTSLKYTLPASVFDVICQEVRSLRYDTRVSDPRSDVHITDMRRVSSVSQVVHIKLVTENLQTLNRLKRLFETILRGDILADADGIIWDPFFERPIGAMYIDQLQRQHPGTLINRDSHKRRIALFGPFFLRRELRRALMCKIAGLRAQKFHTFPLRGRLIGLFMSTDLMKLQRSFGHENIQLDLAQQALKVRGGQDLCQAVRLAIRHAQQRDSSERHQVEHPCPVCFDEVSIPVSLPCGHTWCKSCLADYLRAAIDNKGFPLKCLGNDAHCSQEIPLSVARDILTHQEFTDIAHSSFQSYVQSHRSEFHYCPTPDCPQIYRTTNTKVPLQCPSCLVQICAKCHDEYHDGAPCRDREAEEQKQFEEWAKDKDVKKCPTCRIPIERESGCNHMTCTQCDTHICWVCLSTFPIGGAVYEHMQAVHGGIGI